MKFIINSLYFIALCFVNKLLVILPTFSLRIVLLRIFGFKIGKSVAFHRGVTITSLKDKLVIGDNSVINKGVLLDNRRGLYIGNNVSISQKCSLYTLGHDVDSCDFKTKGDSVYISDYSVLFSNALIMPGVKLGYGSVVLPNSVVNKNFDAYSIVGGVPAVIIRNRSKGLKYTLNYRYWCGI